MPAGFKVVNDHGTVQIDETYSNLHAVSKHTITMVPETSTYPGRIYRGSLTVSGSNPLVAIAGGPVLVVQRLQSGSNFTFTFAASSASATTANITFEAFIFDAPVITTPPAGATFVVRNASNQIVFHDVMKPLRILDVITVNSSAWFGGEATHTYPAGRKIACIPSMDGVYYVFPQYDSNTQLNILVGPILNVNSNVLKVKQGGTVTGRMPWQHWNFTQYDQVYRFIVVDVTGF